MEYTAHYEIDCGVSTGQGIKLPDKVERTDTFSANTLNDAIDQMIKYGKTYAQNYLSNPDTEYTTVRFLSLKGEGETFDFSQRSEPIAIKRHTLEALFEQANH